MATAALASVESAESVRRVIVSASAGADRILGLRGGYTLGTFLEVSRFARFAFEAFVAGAGSSDDSILTLALLARRAGAGIPSLDAFRLTDGRSSVELESA